MDSMHLKCQKLNTKVADCSTAEAHGIMDIFTK